MSSTKKFRYKLGGCIRATTESLTKPGALVLVFTKLGTVAQGDQEQWWKISRKCWVTEAHQGKNPTPAEAKNKTSIAKTSCPY